MTAQSSYSKSTKIGASPIADGLGRQLAGQLGVGPGRGEGVGGLALELVEVARQPGREPQPVAGAHDDVADGPAQPQQHVAQPGAAGLDLLAGPQRLAELVDA